MTNQTKLLIIWELFQECIKQGKLNKYSSLNIDGDGCGHLIDEYDKKIFYFDNLSILIQRLESYSIPSNASFTQVVTSFGESSNENP